MIAKYTNPEIIIPDDAVGIDLAIANIQEKFACKMMWLTHVFGKCSIQHDFKSVDSEKGKKKVQYVYPQVYNKTGEPYNLLMNDNLQAYCFFVVHDPSEFVDYEYTSSQQFMKSKVSIIFWMNCKKVAPEQKSPFNAELLVGVLQTLKLYPYFEFIEYFESYAKVFEGFTLTDHHVQYMKFPYSAFRIDGNITFPLLPENC